MPGFHPTAGMSLFSTATNLDCAATQTPKIWIFTHDRESSHTWLASTPDDGQPITEDVGIFGGG